MAAGLGFKTFNTGEVLTSADVNGYLMQGVLVFASEAARDAAITSPQEGQFAYTKDNNSLWYYTGSAWAASGATGDIEGVTAGTGISGGGTSGTVTITNSMATAIDAKGDLVVGTGADTFARLAVGTNGYTLVADSAETTGLKWAAPSAASFAGASAYKSANQSIENGTFVALTFNTEDFDTDAYHNTSTNTSRFTIPSGKGGKYLLSGAVSWGASNAGTFRLVVVYKNGSIENQVVQFAGTNDGTIQPFACVYNLVATDYLEVFVRHNTGGSLDVQGGVQQTRAQVSYLGA